MCTQICSWLDSYPSTVLAVCVVNKQNQLAWCQGRIDKKDNFENVIWSDECSVQLNHHGWLCFGKIKQPRKLKPRPKHLPKVHIWAAISKPGATSVSHYLQRNYDFFTILFNFGNSSSSFYWSSISWWSQIPTGQWSKHTNNYTKNFLLDNSVNWWKTPAESPDLNPTGNVWGSLKFCLRHQYKPKNLQAVIDGIKRFWSTMSPNVYRKYMYIDHLYKVMPKVVQVEGAASGY